MKFVRRSVLGLLVVVALGSATVGWKIHAWLIDERITAFELRALQFEKEKELFERDQKEKPINEHKQQKETNALYQAGEVVGLAVGGRRSPTDATRYLFAEIVKTGKLNREEPFEFQGYLLLIENVKNTIFFTTSRPLDGAILEDVTAKVVRGSD